jgi:CubicO group peptidase (beta-lactamase class C family)
MEPQRYPGLSLGGRAAEARIARFVLPAVLVLGVGLALAGNFVATALQSAAGFSAKVACSLHFLSGQDPDTVMRDYIDHEILGFGFLIALETDDHGVTARTPFGIDARAVHRPGHGCTLLAGLDEDQIVAVDARPPFEGEILTRFFGPNPKQGPPAVEAAIDAAFREPDDAEGGRIRATTAVVVLHQGRVLAERYAEGYGRDTPMLSWSMGKSVIAAAAGALVLDGKLRLDAPAEVPEWQQPGDPRGAITLDMLLRASSGLAFDETYSATNDVTRMLFTRPDTGAFAAAKPLAFAPDTHWSYSSGTSNIVSRLVAEQFGRDPDAFGAYMRERFFDPCQIRSVIFEPDASGTPIGSSFVFMTALDWARFGEVHRVGGICAKGQRVLPEDWVTYVTTPTPHAPQGRYGAHWWLNAGDPENPADRFWPKLPPDAYGARGHSGQWVVVVPSSELVVVRLGLSWPDDSADGAEQLVADILSAVKEQQ